MNPLLRLLAVVLGKDGVHNFAITQKESITDMLKIGTRLESSFNSLSILTMD